MPNIKSAKKRVNVNAKKRNQNRPIVSGVKSAIKKFNAALDANDVALAETLLPEVFSALDSAAAKGILHKNNAANKKSNTAKRLSDVKSGKIVIVIKKDNKAIAAEKAKLAQEAREAARLEYQKAAAEKKAAKIDAEKAKIAAEAAKNEKPKKAKKEEAVKEEPKAKKAPAKKEEKAADAEEKPKAKKSPAKKEKAE